jgi:hypothetical protein
MIDEPVQKRSAIDEADARAHPQDQFFRHARQM